MLRLFGIRPNRLLIALAGVGALVAGLVVHGPGLMAIGGLRLPVVPGQLSDRALLVGRSAERSPRHLRGRMSARLPPGPPGTFPGEPVASGGAPIVVFVRGRGCG